MALDDFTPDERGSSERRGDYFKPADYETALALLVEPEAFNANARNPFFDEDSPEGPQNRPTRAEAVATISVFENQGQIKDGEPTVIESAIVTNAKLARDLGESNIGRTLLLTVEEQRFKGKKGSYKAWTWVPVEDEKVRAAVSKYVDARDAAADEKAPWED